MNTKTLHNSPPSETHWQTLFYQTAKRLESSPDRDVRSQFISEVNSKAPTLLEDWDYKGLPAESLFELPSLQNFCTIVDVDMFYYFSSKGHEIEFELRDRPLLYKAASVNGHGLVVMTDHCDNLEFYNDSGSRLGLLGSVKGFCELKEFRFVGACWCVVWHTVHMDDSYWHDLTRLYRYHDGRITLVLSHAEPDLSVVDAEDIPLIEFLSGHADELRIRYVTTEQLKDPHQVEQCIEKGLLDEFHLENVSEALKDDDGLFHYCMARMPKAYSVFSERLRSDRTVAQQLLRDHPEGFSSLPEQLQSDIGFIEEALHTNGRLIDHLPQQYQRRLDLIQSALTQYTGALVHKLRFHRESVGVLTADDCIRLLEEDERLFAEFDESVRHDGQVLLHVAKNRPYLLRDVDFIKVSITLLEELIDVNPKVYLYLGEHRQDRNLAKRAFLKFPNVVLNFSAELAAERDFMSELADIHPKVVDLFPEAYSRWPDIVLRAQAADHGDEDEDLPF
jgi:tetratricopeptide (TPR) repeat protein